MGRDKAYMYVEDLTRVLETNLVTTGKWYSHGRYRIQAQVYLQLGGFTANRPKALLSLCYRHVQVTLLRDPEGGPHQVLLGLALNLRKSFLGLKICKFFSLRFICLVKDSNDSVRNTFPIPEVIHDETLTFSLHVFLLRMLFHDSAFAAHNLTSPEELSRFSIPLGRNELPLRLSRNLDDIPIFRMAEDSGRLGYL